MSTPAVNQHTQVITRVSKNGARRQYIFTKRVSILSYGGGLDSTAMLVKMYEEGESFIVLFADTGAETPQTYATIAFYRRWCEDRGIEFVTVRRGDFSQDKRSLDEYHHDKQIIPSKMRRDCTTKFKIQAKRAYLRNRFGTDTIFENAIGYNADEKERAEKQKKKGQDVMYEECTYPMLDEYGMGRQAEKDFLASRNLPIPEKSGCYCCPYTSKNGWKILYFTNRGQFEKAQTYIEENSNEYRKAMLPETPKKNRILLGGTRPLSEIRAECEKMTQEEVDAMVAKGTDRMCRTGF